MGEPEDKKVAPADETVSAEGGSTAGAEPSPPSPTKSTVSINEQHPNGSPKSEEQPPSMSNRKSSRYVPLPGDNPKGIPRERPIPQGVNVTPHPTIPGKFYVDDLSLVRDQIVVPLYADQGGYYVYRAATSKKVLQKDSK